MWVIRAELAIAVIGGLVFLRMYWRGAWRVNGPGRMVMAWAAAGVAEGASLLAVSFGIRLPVALFAVGFAAVDAVVIWRLIELRRARRAEKAAINASEEGSDHGSDC